MSYRAIEGNVKKLRTKEMEMVFAMLNWLYSGHRIEINSTNSVQFL